MPSHLERSVLMAIENRDLPAGTRLVATYKKQAFVCTVEAGEDGKLAFIVDGKRYTSPSSAGSAGMGGSAFASPMMCGRRT